MTKTGEESYFQGLKFKLAIPVMVGACILLIYYYKLLHLSFDTMEKAFLYVVFVVPVFVWSPVPLNRILLNPVIRYLKGTGNPREAEERAAVFPLYSALLSLLSWVVGGIMVVVYSLKVLRLPPSTRYYLFMACVSAGFAASFIHFHLMRQAVQRIRARIALETGDLTVKMRYPILMRLLLSFTLLIALALVFFALLQNAQTSDLLRDEGVAVLRLQLQHWQELIKKDSAMARYLPSNVNIQPFVPEYGEDQITAAVPMGPGRYLVGRFPASKFAAPTGPLQEDDVVIILLIVVVVGVISYFAAADISRPLNQIREATRRIADETFEQPLEIMTDDEVAELARSVNWMEAELRKHIREIQEARDKAQENSSKLEDAYREVMKLDELKADFLANISHELKAPLVSTKGYVDFILGGKLGPINDRQSKGLAVARDNLNHLSRMISSLLDFSKVTSGLIKLHVQPTALRPLIESCVETAILEAGRKAKDVEFSTELPPNLPDVFVDPDRIREVLLNLLLNAEKFTSNEGRIKVTVIAPREEDDFLTVNVIDSGIGIPEEHLPKIFNRFFQVDSSSTRKYGGTGLGLAIVKEIIEAHKCKIHVESGEGIGSKFSFTLPVFKKTEGGAWRRASADRPGKHHVSKLVEVVEDDANIAAIVKLLLEEEGFAVILAPTGEDALMIAREHRPDMITLDIYLPDINGFDLLTKLQADERTRDIPVIVLSIMVDKEKGFRLGALEYLEKPIDTVKLREAVNRLSRVIDGVAGPVRIMIVDDDEDILEFFRDCLSTEGYEIITHAGGRDAASVARREKPGLILLDLVMPDVDGLEVLQQLKSEEETRNVPVIILTGKGKAEDRERSILLGAEQFISKPAELRDIVDQVKRYFGNPG